MGVVGWMVVGWGRVRAGLGWVRSWSVFRRVIGVVAGLVGVAVFGSAAGSGNGWSWWVPVVVVVGGTSLAVAVAALGGARSGRAATLCDLRPVLVGSVALYLAVLPLGSASAGSSFLAGFGPGVLMILRPVLALVGVLAPVWSAHDRFVAEVVESHEGETCSTCVPLPAWGRTRGDHDD
jgi:hypothetical protein